ncbi:MAG: DNA-directed DNA polymerase eta rad30 [Lichina confinis]|nr:MAG: DNA-directed DNA polymerase eta rad30 [Lichina confinis]
MSSSPSFVHSSPLSATVGNSQRRRRSRFTYRHLSQLSGSSANCPLRVIAHVDLDAFYAQCEMKRLGVSEDTPLAVQQWGSFIAINYPARRYGLSRFSTVVEATKVCPHMIMQHVATWKEGHDKWAYHDDAPENIATHKVSLDPYRLQSRQTMTLIKECLPPPPVQRVEKAGVDEVFLDLSAQVHGILLSRYPELSTPAPYDDPTENLSRPPTTALEWGAGAVIDLDETETEDDDPDWDDVAMQIGSEIVRGVRGSIRERLGYTCSAGIARNKTLAKLGSAHNKPNQQTIVRDRAVQQFLSGFKFTKIRNLGGKLGDEIVSSFGVDTVSELLKVPIEQLKRKLGNETGTWVYQTVRGVDQSEVNPRTQIKSMLSAKSFRPTISSAEQAERWLRIFAADIFARLVEEGVLDNRRRPRTINLQHRHLGQTKARSCAIPTGRTIDEVVLFDLARTLLRHIIAEGGVWPCANLSLSVAGFEDGITGNRKIGQFLVTGKEATALRESAFAASSSLLPSVSAAAGQNFDGHVENSTKRRKLNDKTSDEGAGIQKFFRKSTDDSCEKEAVRKGVHATEKDVSSEHYTTIPPPLDKIGDDDDDDDNDNDDDEDASKKRTPIVNHPNAPPLTSDAQDQSQTQTQTINLDKHRQGSTNDQSRPSLPETSSSSISSSSISSSTDTFLCARCQQRIPRWDKDEHDDWHFAMDLHRQEQQQQQRGEQLGRSPLQLDQQQQQPQQQQLGQGQGQEFGQQRDLFHPTPTTAHQQQQQRRRKHYHRQRQEQDRTDKDTVKDRGMDRDRGMDNAVSCFSLDDTHL